MDASRLRNKPKFNRFEFSDFWRNLADGPIENFARAFVLPPQGGAGCLGLVCRRRSVPLDRWAIRSRSNLEHGCEHSSEIELRSADDWSFPRLP